MITNERRLQIGLAVMRISLALFFLIWSTEKLARPENAQEVFERFYLLGIPAAASYAVGVVQTLVILAFLAGLFKTLSYGVPLTMHAVSMLASYQQLLNPYEPPNHLFWAGVPVLGALIALFLLRNSDQLLTAKTTRDWRKRRVVEEEGEGA